MTAMASIGDYFFGPPTALNTYFFTGAGELSMELPGLLLSVFHMFVTVGLSLVVNNLVIAFINDAWLESVDDGAAWRRYGRAAFAVAVAHHLHCDESEGRPLEWPCKLVLAISAWLDETALPL
jgi:hypothetical protein